MVDFFLEYDSALKRRESHSPEANLNRFPIGNLKHDSELVFVAGLLFLMIKIIILVISVKDWLVGHYDIAKLPGL